MNRERLPYNATMIVLLTLRANCVIGLSKAQMHRMARKAVSVAKRSEHLGEAVRRMKQSVDDRSLEVSA